MSPAADTEMQSATPEPAAKPVLIIGGGVAGLSCGCYLQMNGYQTEILEASAGPGGLCTAWERGPYLFDGCLRWLVGTHPSSSFNRIWAELGALDGRQIVNEEEFLRVEGSNGEALSVSADLDQLARDFKRIAPEDARRIDRLMAAARRCAPLDPPERPLELMGIPEKTGLLLRYLPILLTIGTWKNRGFADYVAGYRSSFLREVLTAVVGDARMSALVLVMVLGWRSRRNAGFVVGGSRAFAGAMADRYARLGGRLRCNTQAISVAVENNRAVGVRSADGTTIPASTVVSCADGHTTIFKLLGGRFLNPTIRYLYDHGEVFSGLFQLSLGVNKRFPDAPRAVSLPLSRPLKVDDATMHERLEAAFFGEDSGLCPSGKTIILVRLTADFRYWAELRQNQAEGYKRAKQALLEQVTEILDKRFPGVAECLEDADVASPATFARFTGNWQGSIQGWLPTPRILGRRIPRVLPGLRDFYMAGHWIEPGGGVPSAALSGRSVAQLICARDKKPFTTTQA